MDNFRRVNFSPSYKCLGERHAETPLNSVRSCANQETPSHGRMVQNRVEKMSLFEALELADSIENQENTCQFKPDAGHDTFEQSVTSDITTDSVDLESSDLRRNATCSSTSSAESIKDTRNIHAAVVGINAAPIKSSASFSCSKSQAFKNTPETISVYNRYLRSVFLSKTLEDAHKKRKASAFSQLTALAEENNRLEDQICQLKMDSEKQAYNQVIWDLISVQSEQTAKLAAKLNNFLPLFTKFALLVDSTRHRFFFENINVPSYQIDPESNLRFCAKLTEQLEIQKSLLESIANEEKRSSKHDLQRLVELGEKFLESSKEVDKDIKQCEEKCRELFMCIEQKDSSDLPAILNSVSCVDNCNLDIFKF